MSTNWSCPNNLCEHSKMLHDIEEDTEDPKAMCCVDDCSCGQPVKVPTCPICGDPLGITYMVLSMQGGCERIPMTATCSKDSCAAERRRGQRERDEAAIAEAVAAGVIDP